MILKFELVKVNKLIVFFRVLNVFLFLLFIILTANSVFNANLIWGICDGICVVAFIVQMNLFDMYNAFGIIVFREDIFEIKHGNEDAIIFSPNVKLSIMMEFHGFEGDPQGRSGLISKEGIGKIEVINDTETFSNKFRAKDGCLTKLVKITNEYRKAGVTVDIRSY